MTSQSICAPSERQVYAGSARLLLTSGQVEEETGFNCGHLISPEDFIEFPMNGQEITLFVVPKVPEDTVFKPLTRKEISVSNKRNPEAAC